MLSVKQGGIKYHLSLWHDATWDWTQVSRATQLQNQCFKNQCESHEWYYIKHKSKSWLARWRHRLLWHCSRCTVRGYIRPILVYYLPRLCASNVNIFNERKWLYAGKGKKQKYSAQTIMVIDYADDIVLPANTLTKAESLLHSLEQVAGSIGFHVNADKTVNVLQSKRQHLHTK